MKNAAAHRVSSVFTALLTACVSYAALAQTSAGELADLTLEQLANIEITSVSRRAERLSGAAGSVYVITADDIRSAGVTNLADALRLAPNLHVARADANQYAISARGFNSTTANKMLTLIDGRTVYSPLFSGVFWEAQHVVLEDIERIEVMSGSGGTQWGSNAVNGFINIITRAARDTQGALVLAWPCLPSLLFAVAPGAGARENPATLERRVKAAFLYKFLAYVVWPDSAFSRPDAPLVIGILGDERMAAELAEVVATRTVDGRPLEVKRLRESSSPAGVPMLFVGHSENARLPALARASAGQPVLLVSDAEGALNHGSIINFVTSSGRVKFEIAPDAAERRGVKLSSRLLTVAQAVRPANLLQ